MQTSISVAHLCDHGAGSGALVSPGGWEDTDSLVVAGETVDTGLDENETELGVLVLSVALEMLADSDGHMKRQLCRSCLQADSQTFLINKYRSSGISGARPINSVSQ